MVMPENILKTIIDILAEAEAEAKAEIEAEARAEGLSEAEIKVKVEVFAEALASAEDEIEAEIETLNGLPESGLDALAANLSEVEAYGKTIADTIVYKAKIMAKYSSS